MDIIIDGNKIISRESLFNNLKEEINNREFIGNNLDALWDILTTINVSSIKIINNNNLKKSLGDYYYNLLNLINDLIKHNNNIIFIID